MAYVRTVKTASGATAVQIVYSSCRGSRDIEHIGSAHDDVELELLKAAARQRMAGGQGELDLGLEATGPARRGRGGGPLPITSTRMGRLTGALEHTCQVLGFEKAAGGDEVFGQLVIARIIEPVSKLDSLRVLEEAGVAAASYRTVERRLRVYAKEAWRRKLSAACAAHARLGRASLVLYDVSTLYFEADKGDGFREPGFSKERRLEPQITIGLLTDQAGFPLMVSAFEGNKAETKTMLPVIESFMAAHDLPDVTVVADAGMVSEANQKEIEAAGLSFILGMKIPRVPYALAQWRREHPGEEIPDGHVFTQPWPAGPKAERRDQVIYYQYRHDRARRTLRGIDEQVKKAEQAVAGQVPVKRNRFVQLSGGTRSVNRELEAKARALAGIKGYVTNLAACPDGTPVTGEFVIGACHQLFEIERSFRMSKSDLQARPACHRKRDSIEAHLTIVFAALAVSRWIENQAGWSIRKFVRTARRYRTIEIQAGPHAITAAHPIPGDLRQALDCALPVVVTTAPEATDASGVPVQCVPGLSGGTPDHNAAALAGHTVVHLHGGLTPAASDGWAENLSAPGQDAVFHYPMGQRAALLWYHDHVMGVTRFGVYAGLAGLWIIRDERERELGLPEGPPFEVPLLIQDRNFGLDESGRLTGQLVHKTDPEVMEAFPPFTVVNGKVWPLLEVEPATYRFRVLNGSNARTYRLVLLRDGEPELHRITQIGTDHGLLRTPASLPPDGLVLASAERADLLVDFSVLAPGSELTLVNTAAAPFDGTPFPAANASSAADPGRMLPYPHVMGFRVVPGPAGRRTIPGELATDYRLPAPDALASAPRRTIALVERELEGEPNMLTMRELVIAGDDHTGPAVTVAGGEQTTRYRAAAAHFEDATTFFPVLGRYEVWQLINLTGDTHPIHIHLDPFQVLSRRPIRYQIPDHGIDDFAITAAVRLERDPDDELDHSIDDNERGRKTPSASTHTRSPKSPSASPPTADGTCTTATSSNTKTAT